MRIGVYGDSFADSADAVKPFTWYNLLQKKIKNAATCSHGEGGSSIFFSYSKFLETHENYDSVIFLVTNPNRYPKRIPNLAGFDRYIPGLPQIEILQNDPLISTNDLVTLECLKGYYMIQDDNYNSSMAELMLKHMRTIRQDIIYFPCFPESFTEERREKDHINRQDTMCDFHNRQSKLLDIKINFGHMIEKKTISCHFTEEFSEAIANGFAKKILTSQWDWSDVYNIKKLSNKLTHYYIPRKKNEQATV